MVDVRRAVSKAHGKCPAPPALPQFNRCADNDRGLARDRYVVQWAVAAAAGKYDYIGRRGKKTIFARKLRTNTAIPSLPSAFVRCRLISAALLASSQARLQTIFPTSMVITNPARRQRAPKKRT